MTKIIFLVLLFFVGCAPKGDLVFRDPSQPKDVKATSVDPTFDSIRTNILVPKCLGCHGKGAESPLGIDLSTYENVMDQTAFPPVVTAGIPEESSLYITVHKGTMPKNAKPLSENEVAAIFDWIKNGAKKIEEGSSEPTEGLAN